MHKTLTLLLALLFVGLLTGCSKTNCKLDDRCDLSAEPGLCQAAFVKYFYNPSTGQCEAFTWGGCGEYPFDDLQECESHCGCTTNE